MRILLVDDETQKLKEIGKLLQSIEGISKEDIVYAIDVSYAKKSLIKETFDLMILDLNMPDAVGEEPKDNAGCDFINEIIGVHRYKKPREIVILTAYEDLKKQVPFNKAFLMLKYDESSLEWKEVLNDKVKYILAFEEKNKTYMCECVIITAVDIEFQAVKKISSQWQVLYVDDDTSTYYKTKLNDKIDVVLVQQTEMGIAAAATLASKVLYKFNPKYVIMAGIAAGIDQSNNFGDIIIPDVVWNYSGGKYIENDGKVTFSPDPKYIALDTGVKEKLRNDYTDILCKIKKQWNSPPKWDLNIVQGPLACGAAVIASKDIVNEQILKHSRKTCGLDMESYGVFFAVQSTVKKTTIPICIKSISDYADSQKNNDYQSYAAYTSAEFTKYVILNVLEF
ncbi:Nucleoside phosphorylase [Propionispira arboris]|uniref:Nucleoside phosphorylase n=2 Tax=Propionispira arboris TaxID=84035 RepID=A0A1H7A6Z0_9FIRM|nr:Nucleoside phosphorylase [Propionispira arboris]